METNVKPPQLFTVLKVNRERIYSRVTTVLDAFKTALNIDTVELYRPRYEKLKEFDSEFSKVQEKIIELNATQTDEKERLPVQSVQKAFDDLLFQAESVFLHAERELKLKLTSQKAETSLNKSVTGQSAPSESISVNNLPRISLHSFDGTIEHWTSFYSLFVSLVHENKSLSDIQKYCYLQSHLSNEALATITDFPLSAENYHLAFKALQDRYQNTRRLAEYHFLKLRQFKPGNSMNLQSYLTAHLNSVNALYALKIEKLEDFLLFEISLHNLDAETRREFEDTVSSTQIPTYKELIQFVTEKARKTELIQATVKSGKTSQVTHTVKNRMLLTSTSFTPKEKSNPNACAFCQKEHPVYQCEKFLSLKVPQRYELVKKHYRCFACLGAHHRNSCHSKANCRVCGKANHHTLLHSAPASQQTSYSPPSNAQPCNSLSCNVQTPALQGSNILLGTLKLFIKDTLGHYHLVRGVMDSGSQVSAISSSLSQALGVPRSKTAFDIHGISDTKVRPLGSLECTVRSRLSTDEITFNAIVLPNITCVNAASKEVIERFAHLQLADDDLHLPAKIHVLLGANVIPQLLGSRIVKGNPSAIETVFGYVLVGGQEDQSAPVKPVSLLVSVPPLNELIAKFWELEEVENPTVISPEDEQCEEHFRRTHKRDSHGRYIVSLPFRNNSAPVFDSNKNTALQSLFSLERRFKRQPALCDQYSDCINEYLTLGHLSRSLTTVPYVLPHHPVVKESSTTKVRVVFNASALDASGKSLNQCLLAGPKLQPDIKQIITSFRLYPIAFSCDIKMMFRQIWICSDDKRYQHILWRPSPDSEVLEYELNTLTFGFTSSPFLAQRVLIQMAEDYNEKYPVAAEILRNHVYVDNFLFGGSSRSTAEKARDELIDLLKEGGMELRKWLCNNRSLLEGLDLEFLETPVKITEGEKSVIKVLGLLWNPETDSFQYSVEPFTNTHTKRNILSFIARIFDPLGWLSPVVFWLKCFMQRLWCLKLNWDDHLSEEPLQQWIHFTRELSDIAGIQIPRLILSEYVSAQVIGFSDASSKGYAAVVYLRVVSTSRGVLVNLLQAKSKVAPLKVLTIPRLELMGALLLSKLLLDTSRSKNSTSLRCDATYLFSDSTTVLAWLRTPPHLLQVFVSHRVTRILETTRIEQWSHIPSELNPADLPSRGLAASQLRDNDLWWKGPSFLTDDPRSWPLERNPEPISVPEMKRILLIQEIQMDNRVLESMNRFSSLSRLQRVIAFVLRFIHNTRSHKSLKRSGPLTLCELDQALMKCSHTVQLSHFDERFRKSRTFQSLSPFTDKNGLSRVGGRLRHTNWYFDYKHPIILPKNTHFSRLICDHYHVSSLHAGPRLVQSLILRKFWILSLRNLVRKRIRQCTRCFRFQSRPLQPPMADLPAARVQPSAPFTHTAMDFAGPFDITESKLRKPRQFKAYFCVFVCMATKAIHLEMTLELSSLAFLNALDRFVSRRGLPQTLYSDCGRNFIGASRHLKAVYNYLKEQKDLISQHLVSKGIEWRTSPPYAPNFNGLAEAGVKSVKGLMYRTIGQSTLTIDDMLTLLSRIEAVLNSRPLLEPPSNEDESMVYLTPGHFLLGRAPLSVPDADLSTVPLSKRWHQLQTMYRAFWSLWSKEYLNTLTQRHKWIKPISNLQKGTLVWVTGINTPPMCWPVGVITDIHPGEDGVVRVATVRTPAGTFVRPANRLVPFPSV